MTCWTCHRNRDKPLVTPTLATIYGTPTVEPDDVITQVPGRRSAESILDRYIQALGGAQRLAGLTSYFGKGIAWASADSAAMATVEIVAKAPDKRATIILFKEETSRGDQIRTYDGRTGWVRTPLNVVRRVSVDRERSGRRQGGRAAVLSGQIKRSSRICEPARRPPSPICRRRRASRRCSRARVGQNHVVDVVQGTGPRGLLVTLYFDQQTGLLLRELRYGLSPIGRVPTQIDFADYRDVNGIKLPFRMTFAWLDGRDAIVLDEIRTNVPVDEAKFGTGPAPSRDAEAARSGLKLELRCGLDSRSLSYLRRPLGFHQPEEELLAVGEHDVPADGIRGDRPSPGSPRP